MLILFLLSHELTGQTAYETVHELALVQLLVTLLLSLYHLGVAQLLFVLVLSDLFLDYFDIKVEFLPVFLIE